MVNNYDDYASGRKKQLTEGTLRSHKYVEKPMMAAMLPDLIGKKVLMLGSGTGEESEFLKSKGAQDLIGMDLSEGSVKIANESFPNCEFIVGDMHQIPFDNETFDFVYSSLTIHYTPDPKSVYHEISRVLKKGGGMLFSLGHPMRWSGTDVEINDMKLRILGYGTKGENEQLVYGDYMDFALHRHFFPTGEVLEFYSGPPSLHFKQLKECGFTVEDFQESKCIEEMKEKDINYYNRFSKIPQFMAFRVRK